MDRISKIEEGTVLQDRYEVEEPLGEGGFGQVYRARQRTTGQEVAIKVLKPRWAEDSTQLARFQREMKLCARLCHPHIVRLLDTGRTEAGHLYIAFELVQGRLLADVLAEEGALAPREVTHLMAQVLDALTCAHKRGVLHRDLKPHNIILSATGTRRNALVLDFGLGKLTKEFRQGEDNLTLSRELMGTPAYAAPELLRGEEATVRSDLYAWALIFLECLTGQRMVQGGSLQEVIARQLSPTPLPVPEPLRRQRLGRLLERALAKAPEAREVTAAELLQTLEDWPLEQLGRRPAWGSSESVAVGRRQVTALCVGLSLGGPGLEGLDEEDVDEVLLARREACLEVARRHEVSATSTLGSRLLLCVGYPQAREEDARRAARLALELAQVLEQYGAELASRGLELEYRMGLHTGVLLHPERSGPFGTTLEVAACLEALAPAHTVLASEATARLLRGHFALEPAGAHRLPGHGQPANVLRLGPPPEACPPLPPLLGRSQELELLHHRWHQATLGQGQALLLLGEPGLGKSRLVHELGRQLHGSPHLWLECRCSPERRLGLLHPAAELLERLLGLAAPQAPCPRSLAALQALLARLELPAAEHLPPLAALLGLPSPPCLQERTLESLLSVLFSLTERHAVLLTVEDLHWADEGTLELLGRLVEDAPATRLFALLTARPEFTSPWPAMQVHPVQLGRLEPQHAEQLVRALSADRHLPPEQVSRIVQHADGVPLFLEELTGMALEPGAQLAGARGEAVPPLLRELLMARLDRLGPALETAQLAAALGREFSDELLRALSPLPPEVVQQHLAALSAADLVYRRRGTRQHTWHFKHSLLRDTAYESMPRSTRRQVHARIAAVLQERFPELVERQPELLAHHTAASR